MDSGGAFSAVDSQLYLPGMLVSLAVMTVLLWFGVRQFRNTEKSFADLI